MRRQRFLLALSILLNTSLLARAAELKDEVENYIQIHQEEIIDELVDVLSIPNDASDRENIRLKAERLQKLLAHRGMESELLETKGNPLVYGELRVVPRQY